MKKALLGFACALFLMMVGTKAGAQISGVDLQYAGDSLNSYCVVPASSDFYLYGTISGTPATNDSMDIHVNFGDGTDTAFKLPVVQTYFYGFITHNYQISGTFAAQVTATSPNNISDTLVSNSFTLTNACAPLSGKLYVDANSNCVFDAGEIVFTYGFVVASDGAGNYFYSATDANGDYLIGLPPGATYTITPSGYYNYVNLTPACPASGTATVTVAGGMSYTQDFAYACSTSGGTLDANVYGWAGSWRPGFDRYLFIDAGTNNVCTAVPATITATLPAGLSYTATNYGTAPSSVSGNVLTWNVAALSDIGMFFAGLDIHCDPNATLGDTLCVTLNVTTNPADANATNNTYDVCAIVSNSYDPNQKSVAPKGDGPQGFIAAGTELEYLVEFQNTGNDVAYTVTVEDAIDADLDISTLKVIRSSHAMVPNITAGNVVKFRFDNINLPDSGANEPASHGYVLYSIRAKSNLAAGTPINNTADILFDYNEAIVTNTTLNTIAIPTTIENVSNADLTASIYPNPANNSISVAVKNADGYTAELYDMLGRPVSSVKTSNGKAVLNVQGNASGTYMLRIVTSDNKVLTTKVSVQH